MFMGNSVFGKMNVNELCLRDIEKMVKYCIGYFKVSKMWYLKSYEGAANDLKICLNPLITDKHLLDMVQVAKANGNEVKNMHNMWWMLMRLKLYHYQLKRGRSLREQEGGA